MLRDCDAKCKKTYYDHFAAPEITENKFNYGWLCSFLERHNLKLSAPEMIDDLRMKYGNQGTIQRRFNQNRILASCFKQQNIFNMDEMNIKVNSNQRVIAKANSKAYKYKGKEFKHITACCCFSAFGHQMPIYLLSDFYKLHPELIEIQDSNHMTFGASKSGWITREHFFEWCKRFVHWCNTITDPSEKRLLYLDSHNSRENADALIFTGLYPFDETNPLSSPYTQPETIDHELQDLNGRLRISSRELTSEDYIQDLKTRDFLKAIKPSCRIQYSSCIDSKKLDEETLTPDNLNILKNISSLDATKFLDGIKNLLDSDINEIIYPNPIKVMFGCASLYKSAEVSTRQAEWLNKYRGMPISLTYNQKIRYALDIAETAYGLEPHDYRHEDMFRKELYRMEEYNSIRLKKNCSRH